MLKYVTNLVGDRCRGFQTMIRSSLLLVASQTRIIKPFINEKKRKNTNTTKTRLCSIAPFFILFGFFGVDLSIFSLVRNFCPFAWPSDFVYHSFSLFYCSLSSLDKEMISSSTVPKILVLSMGQGRTRLLLFLSKLQMK